MHDELVKRLRAQADAERYFVGEDMLYDKAADVIEELSTQFDNMNEENIALYGALPKWIPVTEELPESDTNVLVKSGSFVSVWSLREGDVYWEDEYSYFHDMCEVTHWMPIPEPPKEELA